MLYDDEIKTIELDRDSMDALISLLNEQREVINPELPKIDKEVNVLNTQVLIAPNNSELQKQLNLAKAKQEIMGIRI